jgi:hypothetical protein
MASLPRKSAESVALIPDGLDMPKYRWLRFSVRTLLVAVTICCVWLGWQVSIVHERKALRAMVIERGGLIDTAIDAPQLWFLNAFDASEPSWFRKRLGDEFVLYVYYSGVSEAERQRIARAFPDAWEIRQVTDSDRLQHNLILVDGRWVDSGFRGL